MIEVVNVSKKFKDVTAVKNVSFIVPDGKTVALIGANGSGKTTTMRMISTLIEPTSGRIIVNGYDVKKDVKEVRRQIGLMLGGDASLMKNFTARENIVYFARMQNMTKTAAEEKTDYICRELRMNDYADKKVETFSRGMRQKVILAQALVHNPPILLMDEPSTGLDIFAAIEIQNIIRGLQRDKIILISSHNMDEVKELCEYAIILHKGEVLYTGSIDELLKTFKKDSIRGAFSALVEEKREV